jgi:hypothetical protein
MVSRFVRPGERIHVLEFFQRLVQMAPDYVSGRDGFSLSSAEEETSFAVANKLFEDLGYRRMKIDLIGEPAEIDTFISFVKFLDADFFFVASCLWLLPECGKGLRPDPPQRRPVY